MSIIGDRAIAEWAKQSNVKVGNPPSSITVQSVTSDKYGNVYTVGTFFGTVPISNFKTITSEFPAPFITKQNSCGQFQFIITGITSNVPEDTSPKTNSITIDDENKLFVTGTYAGTLEFIGQAPISTPTTNSMSYTVRLDYQTGNAMWLRSSTEIPSVSGTIRTANAITTDDRNGVYITGQFSGTVYFNTLAPPLISGSGSDVYLVKLNKITGQFMWTNQSKEEPSQITSSVEGKGLAILNEYCYDKNQTDTVYLIGSFHGQARFSDSINFTSVIQDTFIVGADTKTGTWLLGTQTISTDPPNGSSASGQNIAIDKEYIYITGFFFGTTQFGSNSEPLMTPIQTTYISKLSKNLKWLKTVIAISTTSINIPTGLDISSNNKYVYASGFFSGTVEFGNLDPLISDRGASYFTRLTKNLDFTAAVQSANLNSTGQTTAPNPNQSLSLSKKCDESTIYTIGNFIGDIAILQVHLYSNLTTVSPESPTDTYIASLRFFNLNQ